MFFVKATYAVMGVVLLLMTWAYLVGARDDINRLQPCQFNPLCRCSSPGPELGLVYCEDFPLADIPLSINNTKVFALNLRNNALRRLEDNRFHGTGLWRVAIRSNLISSVPESAFAGLERSLWELDLRNNQLQRVPQKALHGLQKLKVLDLAGNRISEISREDFKGLEVSLQSLSLAENDLNAIQPDMLRDLQRLEKLDLRGNSILTVTTSGLQSGPPRLSYLNLADNLLDRIPFVSLAQMKSLHTVQLENNRIASTFDVFFQGQLSLDTLVLNYNLIDNLPPFSFQNFININKTSLVGNPIQQIAEDAFKEAKIRELDLSDCALNHIAPKAFRGLETSLQRLDVSNNNLTTLPAKLFDNFDYLKIVNFNDNVLAFNPEEAFNGFRYTLQHLNLVGHKMGRIPIDQLHNMRNLRTLGLSTLVDDKLSAEDFEGFGPALENLYLSRNQLKALQSYAFRHVSGLKTLDLSENKINKIEADAFRDVATSLQNLNLANGLSMTTLPPEPLKKLTAVRDLNLGNNRLVQIPVDVFHSMRELRHLNLQDNRIEKLPLNLFKSEFNPCLERVLLSFNNLRGIDTQTFTDLPNLRSVRLDDNQIQGIDKNAFQNLNILESIHLEGNRLEKIETEAFQNLPKLDHLNLAHNRLTSLNLDAFDQVGTLSSLRIDVRFNKISKLEANPTGWTTYSSIRQLDMGHNNISVVTKNYFDSIRVALTHLYLDDNQLSAVPKDVFADMQHLQWLDLSNNKIETIHSDGLKNNKKLQILVLQNNKLQDLPPELFNDADNLRVLSLAKNNIRFLPDGIFKDTQIDTLDVSRNQLTKFPDSCLSKIASTLRHLTISHNEIAVLNADQLERFVNLVHLDISFNEITSLNERTFAGLERLTSLDLAGNHLKTIPAGLFETVANTLGFLNLAHTGLTNIPEMTAANNLLSLNISDNKIATLSDDVFGTLGNLQILDISNCSLETISSSVWSSVLKLKELYINGNPIRAFTNESFVGLERLQVLDIHDLPLETFEEGALHSMPLLTRLKLSTYAEARGLNIADLISGNVGIQTLELEVETAMLEHQLRGDLPFKLTNLTITGSKLRTITSTAFQDMKNRNLKLTLKDSNVAELPKAIFRNMGQVRWLQLDLRQNRLTSVAEPSTTLYPGSSSSVFINQLLLSSNPWNCDCNVGWVEFWMRKWRQYLCDYCPDYDDVVGDLRQTECRNRGNSSVVEIIKTELECGWSKSSSLTNIWQQWVLIIMAGIVAVQKLF